MTVKVTSSWDHGPLLRLTWLGALVDSSSTQHLQWQLSGDSALQCSGKQQIPQISSRSIVELESETPLPGGDRHLQHPEGILEYLL